MSSIDAPAPARRVTVAGDPVHDRPMFTGVRQYEVRPADASVAYKYEASFSYYTPVGPEEIAGLATGVQVERETSGPLAFTADDGEHELAELLACPCATTV